MIPAVDDRRGSGFFGLPAMMLAFALVAVFKGLAEENLGFTIVGAIVAAGIFLAIGLAMTIAKRS
jgi:lipopolysaccharide export LptBFGC system permease protein LptF